MRQYLIKQGNTVKFFPRELYDMAVQLLGQDPHTILLGDNAKYDQSGKVDCLPYASYIAGTDTTAADLDLFLWLEVVDSRKYRYIEIRGEAPGRRLEESSHLHVSSGSEASEHPWERG